MKARTRQWMAVTLLSVTIICAIAATYLAATDFFSKQEPQINSNARTEQLVNPQEPRFECETGVDHTFIFVRCQSEDYGRMVFLWLDASGQQFVIGDGVYTRDYGILIAMGTDEVVVTFTDMDGNTAWRKVEVVSSKRQCTAANDCFRVNSGANA